MIDSVSGTRTDTESRRAGRAVSSVDDAVMSMADFYSWFNTRTRANSFQVERIAFADLSGWGFDPDTGNLVHESGRFFSLEGLRVRTNRSWVSEWGQPIIVQPEIGVLGILVKRFDGVLHCLMQAKMEPGNINGVQISPTVQATRSNYLRIHGGLGTKYLEYFRPGSRGRVLFDGLQSEQGSWFLHKRNRHIVVETDEDVQVDEDFCWLTLGQLHRLLLLDHMVNMDARSVLSCIPPALTGPHDEHAGDDSFTHAVLRSLAGHGTAVHESGQILSWLTEVRARQELVQRRVPLMHLVEDGWRTGADVIDHRDGKYFDVIAVAVQGSNREVTAWTQPLLAPKQAGLLALLVKRIGGTLHALVQARSDAGMLNVAELTATVHCQPGNYADTPPEHRPPFLDYVLTAPACRVRWDVLHSEEGGRFHHAQNRYLMLEVEDELVAPDDRYRWMTLHQLTSLLPHSNYLTVELRSLVASMRSLTPRM
ncbi:NDP-hexose 2,3-dehydratase family protein [Salinispora arenicola]|uniref:NDP-hexose 2,3-dehydratase family protein n=1 Tax=Salinispora arenicola TaxID=168697 RepID=UPI00207A46C7|nr:NDP-hexose 2,3-dehydratase family protein [Salinispora arenicola]MCN0179059.1 NDP-hexose 2,3-dehydratase family protein [Salinispora arenicola]